MTTILLALTLVGSLLGPGSVRAAAALETGKPARGSDYQKFQDLNVQVLGISSDGPFALKAFADSLKLPFPMLSDQNLKTIRCYGVVHPDNVSALRSYFLVDEKGILRKQWLLGAAGDDIVFPSEPIRRAIQELAARR